MEREGTFLWKSSSGFGPTWGSAIMQGKDSVRKEGGRTRRSSGRGKRKEQGQRGASRRGIQLLKLAEPFHKALRFQENVRHVETGPGWSGANPGDRAISELARGGPAPGTRAPHSWLLPAGSHRARIPRPAAFPGPFPPFVKDNSRSFRKRHLR